MCTLNRGKVPRMESGRVGEVARLLQLVTVLRAGDGLPVPRQRVVASVEEYRTSKADPESVNKMIERDLDRLGELGIVGENVAPAGSESAYVLRDGAWRLPLELSPLEEGLLAWVMAAAGAAGAEARGTAGTVDDLSGLLGVTPRSLDIAQAAIAGRRALVIVRDGEEREFVPSMLANRAGKWFVLGVFEGETEVKGPRLDRLDILRMGGRARPTVVERPDEILDATAWGKGQQVDAELRCRREDLNSVRIWFPRAEISDVGDGCCALRFWVRDEPNLIDRVIGLAGAAWIVAPESAAKALRQQVSAVVAAGG